VSAGRLPSALAAALLLIVPVGLAQADDDADVFVFGSPFGDEDDDDEVIELGSADDEDDEVIRLGAPDPLAAEDDDRPARTDPVGEAAGPVRVTARLTTAILRDLQRTAWDIHTTDLGLDARLGLEQRLSARYAIAVSGRLRHQHLFPAHRDEDPIRALTEVELREARLDAYFPWLDLRVGNLFFAWGANEGIAPADVINAMDLRFGLASGILGGTDGKIPVPAVQARAFLEPFSFTAVLEPVFVPHRMWLFGYDYALAGDALPIPTFDPRDLGLSPTGADRLQPFLFLTDVPEAHPRNWQVAGRVEASLPGGYRVALSAFDRWDRMPRQTIDPDLSRVMAAQATGESVPFDVALRLGDKLQAGETLYEATVSRMRLFTLDAELPAGPLTLRFDAGYSPSRTLYAVIEDEDLMPAFTWTEHPVLSGGLGVEYFSLTGLTVGAVAHLFAALQVPGDRILVLLEDGSDFPETLPPPNRTVALHGVLAYGRYGFFDDRLEVVAGGLYNTSSADFFFFPAVVWRANDHHRLTLSAQLLGGPSWSPGGLLSHKDRVGLAWTLAY
jgi:hypothetical protein